MAVLALLPFTLALALFVGTLLSVALHWLAEIAWDEFKRAVC